MAESIRKPEALDDSIGQRDVVAKSLFSVHGFFSKCAGSGAQPEGKRKLAPAPSDRRIYVSVRPRISASILQGPPPAAEK